MKINSYEDLIVWQKSMDLVEEVYILTKKFPREELYGLTSQMRRCVVSIPSNIAEGSRRSSKKDFRNFLFNSYGSGAELETQIKITKRLYFSKLEDCKKAEGLLSEIMKMLNTMISRLNNV